MKSFCIDQQSRDSWKPCVGSAGNTFVFVDAPNTPDGFGSSSASIANADPAWAPRAWWNANEERTKAVGLEKSLITLRDVLKTRRFDGVCWDSVFSVSQGAAMAAVLAALLENPYLHPPFLVDGKPPHPPLQFCVVMSGFKVNDPIATLVLTPSYATPTLHVIGRTDMVVPAERSRLLSELSINKRVEEHDGGHVIVSNGLWQKILCDYLRDPFEDVPSPWQALSPGPNSGTVISISDTI